MSRRKGDTDCPQGVRRSARERHLVYVNLDEDLLISSILGDRFNEYGSKNRYALESAPIASECPIDAISRRTLRSSNRLSPPENPNNSRNGFENDSLGVEDENSRSSLSKRSSENGDMYERIKCRRQCMSRNRSEVYSPESKEFIAAKQGDTTKKLETEFDNLNGKDERETKTYDLRPRFLTKRVEENSNVRIDPKRMFSKPFLLKLEKERGVREMSYSNLCSDIDPVSIDPTINFDKIGGLDEHLMALKEMILLPLCYPELFKEHDVSIPKGVLFYGPPGTGKTLVARALANHCKQGGQKISFFMRKGADCLSKWAGDSERQLKLLFKQAYDMRPSIIFFDEIDGLAPARSLKQEQIYSSIVSTLLALMDGVDNRGEVIVIGATNRLDSIDPALRRPGRFDREMPFKLPDLDGRISILKIHTSSWNRNRPSDDDLEHLASKTQGFCGADLRALCSEAFFVALRSHYPQIYFTTSKLAVNSSELIINRNDFDTALKNIVPASRRDFTIPSRQLNARMNILMGPFVDKVIEKIPSGYLGAKSKQHLTGEARNLATIQEMATASTVAPARILIYGNGGEFGHTSHVLPAVVNRMDHLAIYPLSIATLFSKGQPEEYFSNIIQAAVRSISRGTPSVLVISSLDVWLNTVPIAVWSLLTEALDHLSGLTSVLFLATAEHEYKFLDSRIKELFNRQQVVEVDAPSESSVSDFFAHILDDALIPPKRRLMNIELPKLEIVKERVVNPNSKEVEEAKKNYIYHRNEMIMRMEQRIGELMRNRKFAMFAEPVNAAEVPDYYDIITNPMDLGKMLNRAPLYRKPQDMMADFKLILQNAESYNDMRSEEGRSIIISARELYRKGTRAAFELSEECLALIEESAQVLQRADVDFEELDRSVFIVSEDHINESKVVSYTAFSAEEESNTENETIAHAAKHVKRKNRRKAKRKHKNVSNGDDESSPDQSSPDCKIKKSEECVENSCGAMELAEPPREKEPDSPQTVVINENEIVNLRKFLVERCKGWSAKKLEQISSAISFHIHKYSNSYNRSSLPSELRDLVMQWKP